MKNARMECFEEFLKIKTEFAGLRIYETNIYIQ